MPADKVKNARSFQSSGPGSGFAAGDVTEVAAMLGKSPSGAWPISCGVRENQRAARSHTVSTMTKLIAAAAIRNPAAPIAAIQRGEKITPPILAPLYAMPRAAGRLRTNQGETIALIAEALVAPQPAPLNKPATRSCQGVATVAQMRTPVAMQIDPAFVTVAVPKRRWSAGRFAATTAPMRKCTETAVEIRATGQPLVSRSTFRK